MDFLDTMKQLSDRAEKLKINLQTEEATKNALIMPFIQALGYDVFNPLEVLPEFICDIGIKKGEKIDYAIMREGEPVMLIECKHWQQNLTLHDNQLLRYFNVSTAKFGLLTNGIVYKFYTDLETPNKMDEKPFLEIDITNLSDANLDEVKKFHKAYFDVDNILSSASELKYTRELKAIINKEFANPTPELVKFFARQVYDGMITSKLLEQFTILVKKSISGIINDAISDRFKTALKTQSQDEINDKENAENVKLTKEENKIVTTAEEIEGFFIVKSILRDKINPERINYRDALSYFAILLDDNNRKPICRLALNSATNKQLILFDENKKEVKIKIQNIDEIYKYSEDLIKGIEKYLS